MSNSPDTARQTEFRAGMIVDDHPLFCDALSMTLKAIVGLETITCHETLGSALETVQGGNVPDIIVLDLNLPDVSGLDGLIRLHKACETVPIIVVSSMADDRMIASTLGAGASGFVPKHSQRSVFKDAFEAIGRGERFTPDGFVDAGGGKATEREDALARLSLLTNQQARILDAICSGKLNKQIAYDLSIAETTVKAHVTAIMRKLGVQSRTQAVLIAQQANFANFLPSG